MQNAQEINWLVVLAPSLIVGLLAIVTQLLLAYWLSKVTESYKKDLSKEIEDYKIQLQSEFQTKFYEFQTRYSLFHQRRVDAIAELYTILVDLETKVEHTYYRDGEQRQKESEETINKYHEYINFYLKNQIYFEDDLCQSIEEIREAVSEMIDRYVLTNIQTKHSKQDRLMLPYAAEAGLRELEAHQKFRIEFPKLRQKLRDEIRKILST